MINKIIMVLGWVALWVGFAVVQAQEVTQRAFSQGAGAGFSNTGVLRHIVVPGQAVMNASGVTKAGKSGNVGFLVIDKRYNTAPAAVAGEDFLTLENAEVKLDGSGSVDLQSDLLSYQWESLDGVALTNKTGSAPVFVAPDVLARKDYRFVLKVFDGELYSTTDTVVVTVADPSWIPVRLSNSAVTYATVVINDTMAAAGDLVGAYVGGQCRGVSEIVNYAGKAYAVFNIQTEYAEVVNFEVYDASEDRICLATQTYQASPGSGLGSFANPIALQASCSSFEAAFRMDKSATCTGSSVKVEFTGAVAANTQFLWSFDGASILSGEGKGPFVLTWDSPGTRLITLELRDNELVSNKAAATIYVGSETRDTVMVRTCDPLDLTAVVDTFMGVGGCDSIIVRQKMYEETLIRLSGQDDYCGGNSFVQVEVLAGPEPFQYQWNTGNYEARIPNVGSGTFRVTVTDAVGCTRMDSLSLSATAPLELSASVVSGAGCSVPNGTAVVVATGGVLPYTFAWDNGEKDSLAFALSIGNHEVSVTDAAGCTRVAQVSVYPSGFPIVKGIQKEDYSCGNKGSIAISMEGGQRPYLYAWSNGATDSVLTDLDPGMYKVTVTDQNGCNSISPTIEIVADADALELNWVEDDCTLEMVPARGTEPYTFSWGDGSNDSKPLDPIVKGQLYKVTVTDSRGCTMSDSLTARTGVLDAGFRVETQGKKATFIPSSIGFSFWEFGDDMMSATAVPTHQYKQKGTYLTRRTTFNSCGIDTSSYTLVIGDDLQAPLEDLARIQTSSVTTNSAKEAASSTLTPKEPEIKILVYPNPTDGLMKVEINAADFLEGSYVLRDALGRILQSNKISGKQIYFDVDLSNEPDGIYWLGIHTGQTIKSTLLIKQNN